MKKNHLKLFIVFLIVTILSLSLSISKNFSLVSAAIQSNNVSSELDEIGVIRVVDEADANLVSYDYATSNIEFLYFDNSYWEDRNSFSCQDDFGSELRDLDYVDVSDSTQEPYRYVAGLFSTYYGTNPFGTGFFIGPNILLTAGHCVIDYDFISAVFIKPSYDNGTTPFNTIDAERCLISKEYYDFKRSEYLNNIYNNNSLYDWAIIIVEKTSSLSAYLNGNFGKIANYSSTNVSAQLIGYPGGVVDMKISNGQITGYNSISTIPHSFIVCHNCKSDGGSSGSPIVIYLNGLAYVVGILTTYHAGVLIDSFIYRLTNSILADKGVEIRDYYFETVSYSPPNNVQLNVYEENEYNCVVKYIVSPKANETISLSNDGSNYSVSFTSQEIRYYTSGNSSNLGQYEYDYFRVYNSQTLDCSYYQLSNLYSIDERSSRYCCTGRTSINSVIDTSSSNYFDFSNHINEYLRGSFVYNGKSKNIDIKLKPLLAIKSVVIDDVTFTITTYYPYFYVRASTSVTCGLYDNFFAYCFSS